MWPHRQRGGAGVAKAIPAQEAVVTDQPGASLLVLRYGVEHGGDIVVVAVRLVDEALAVGQHTDDARLAAFDDVREVADAAITVRYLGHRGPGDRRLQVGGYHAAG
ncbi:hypothetical protein D3C80_1721650 [compost metagenome]